MSASNQEKYMKANQKSSMVDYVEQFTQNRNSQQQSSPSPQAKEPIQNQSAPDHWSSTRNVSRPQIETAGLNSAIINDSQNNGGQQTPVFGVADSNYSFGKFLPKQNGQNPENFQQKASSAQSQQKPVEVGIREVSEYIMDEMASKNGQQNPNQANIPENTLLKRRSSKVKRQSSMQPPKADNDKNNHIYIRKVRKSVDLKEKIIEEEQANLEIDHLELPDKSADEQKQKLSVKSRESVRSGRSGKSGKSGKSKDNYYNYYYDEDKSNQGKSNDGRDDLEKYFMKSVRTVDLGGTIGTRNRNSNISGRTILESKVISSYGQSGDNIPEAADEEGSKVGDSIVNCSSFVENNSSTNYALARSNPWVGYQSSENNSSHFAPIENPKKEVENIKQKKRTDESEIVQNSIDEQYTHFQPALQHFIDSFVCEAGIKLEKQEVMVSKKPGSQNANDEQNHEVSKQTNQLTSGIKQESFTLGRQVKQQLGEKAKKGQSVIYNQSYPNEATSIQGFDFASLISKKIDGSSEKSDQTSKIKPNIPPIIGKPLKIRKAGTLNENLHPIEEDQQIHEVRSQKQQRIQNHSQSLTIKIPGQAEESFIIQNFEEENNIQIPVQHFEEPILKVLISDEFLNMEKQESENPVQNQIQRQSEQQQQNSIEESQLKKEQKMSHGELVQKTKDLSQKVQYLQKMIKQLSPSKQKYDGKRRDSQSKNRSSRKRKHRVFEQQSSGFQTTNKNQSRKLLVHSDVPNDSSPTNKSKQKQQKIQKLFRRRTPREQVSLNFDMNLISYAIDQRKQFETERNPYLKQCNYLREKLKQLQLANSNLQQKFKQQRKRAQSLQKDLSSSNKDIDSQQLKSSRKSQKKYYAGKIVSREQLKLSPFKNQKEKSLNFRIKKANNSGIENFSEGITEKTRRSTMKNNNSSTFNDNVILPVVNSSSETQSRVIHQHSLSLDLLNYDLEIPDIPEPPKVTNTEVELIRLAEETFKVFGVQIDSKARTLNIKKFKNCVLFILNKEQTIVWHFEGRFYYGAWEPNYDGGQKNGSGFQLVPGKYAYQGEFKENRRSGSGTIKMIQNGIIYAGEWKNGNKNGFGREKDDSGIYEGQWKDGMRHGKGRIVLIDQQETSNHKYSFQGEFVKGLKNGYGIEYFKNGDQYRGQYFNGKFHGKGLYIWATDAHYDGEFKEGMRHGKGLWKSPRTNDFFEGEYAFNQKNGFGIYKWGDGSQYVGYFDQDMQNGQGKFTSVKGQVKQCIWKNGKATKQIKRHPYKAIVNRMMEETERNPKSLTRSPQVSQRKKVAKSFVSREVKSQNKRNYSPGNSAKKFKS